MAELLIVVIIMIMLVAAALPVAKKVMDDSHVRESSRQLNAFLQMAKARAIQTGRPCGLYLDCTVPPLGRAFTDDEQVTALNPNPPVVRAVTELYLAEVPAPYAGGQLDSVAKIHNDGSFAIVDAQNPPQSAPNEMAILQSLLTVGERFQVRFDHKGSWYNCIYDTSGFRYQPPLPPIPIGYVYPYGYGGSPNLPGVKFQIRRSPRKIGQPLALPTGTCIDMRYSGVGPTADRFPAQPSKDMTILFTPNGGVDELVITTRIDNPPSPPTLTVSNVVPPGTLYFLVGKIDKVNDALVAGVPTFFDIRDSNLADPTSLWVTVGRSNGQVTTSENVPDQTPILRTQFAAYLRAARQVATSREQMKGR